MRRIHSGFTLVELMIVVVVLAVLATVAIPNLRQMIQKSQVKDVSSALASSMMLARSEAVAQGRSILVCITSSTSCSTSNSDTWEDGWIVIETTGPTVIRRVQAFDDAVGVTQAETIGRVSYAANGAASFDTNDTSGGISAGNKTFVISNTCWTKNFDVTATGRVDNTQDIAFLGC